MGIKRIYKIKMINKLKKDNKRIFGPTKNRDGTWRIKTNLN
jgi:hypothetical protein